HVGKRRISLVVSSLKMALSSTKNIPITKTTPSRVSNIPRKKLKTRRCVCPNRSSTSDTETCCPLISAAVNPRKATATKTSDEISSTPRIDWPRKFRLRTSATVSPPTTRINRPATTLRADARVLTPLGKSTVIQHHHLNRP